MPDVDLRQLERAAAQGDVGAGERLLRERLRRGLIDEERVRLAAWLGDPAARGVFPAAAPDASLGLTPFFDRLADWGRAIAVRGACALARSLAPDDPEAARRTVSLILLGPDRVELPLEPGRPVVVGRGSRADLSIAEERVSRQHCEIARDAEGRVTVRDLGSKNGTFLGSEALGEDPVRVFDGNVLRLSSAAVEVRCRSRHRSQACLDTVLAWLDGPTPDAASTIDRALDSLDRMLQSPFDHAVRAAAHAALSDPPTPGYFLERIESFSDERSARQVVRRALLPLALAERPLPVVPDPPAQLSRASRPRRDPSWREYVMLLERELGLRAQRRLDRFENDRRGPILARRPDGTLQQVTLLDEATLDLEQEEAALIVRQATAAAARTHPHLAPFLGCHVATLQPYPSRVFVLRSEHIVGCDLKAWIARCRPTPAQAVEAFRGLCGAAQALGEVLPSLPIDVDSIRIDAAGRAHLAGLVEAWAREAVRREFDHDGGADLERLAHVSPEEAAEASAVRALSCGVYRLASHLFLALTGRVAFPPTSARVLLAILDLPPPVPSSLSSELSPELDAVILKALAKAPEDRYPDPLAFGAALAETPEGREGQA